MAAGKDEIRRTSGHPGRIYVGPDFTDPGYLIWRVRKLYQTICTWKGHHAHARLQLLLYLRELGEAIHDIDIEHQTAAQIDEFFESYRFNPAQLYMPVPIRPSEPPMVITPASLTIQTPPTTSDSSRSEPLSHPLTRSNVRRRLDFEDRPILEQSIDTIDEIICRNCFKNILECNCLEAAF